MESNTAEATRNRMYEDFEPYCKWLTKDGQATLEINLKGIEIPFLLICSYLDDINLNMQIIF